MADLIEHQGFDPDQIVKHLLRLEDRFGFTQLNEGVAWCLYFLRTHDHFPHEWELYPTQTEA